MAGTGRARTVASYAWAFSPFYTFGFGTPITIGFAAARLRSAWLWLSLIPYLACVVAMFGTAESAEGGSADAVFVVAWLSSMLGGTIHALAVRRRVFLPPALPGSLEYAELQAHHRRELRVRAAEIVRSSPQTAREMRIGRPDLPRDYDDGGLVDLNHAPASALMTIPGMTPDQAERIVRVRADIGGFASAEEVAALTDLPPSLTPVLREHTVFLP